MTGGLGRLSLQGLALRRGWRLPSERARCAAAPCALRRRVLLTKVTPGVGLLWFAIRREWRSLSIALGATAAVCVALLVVVPELWARWLATAGSNAGRTADPSVPSPLPVRVVLATILVTWGDRTDRPWTVGVACMLGLPSLWPHGRQSRGVSPVRGMR